ncbi:MAG: hypothetical protein NZL85_02050, partial [Fimbriimonadales bacterium]|nr:hypothetical protein [Fimbriimonadales bacterium]
MTSREWRLRIETVGYWLIGLSLLIGLWRVQQTEQVWQQALAHQARLPAQLARFQAEAAHCERLVAMLGASQSEAVRASGANPAMLRQQLATRLAIAQREFHTLRALSEPLLQQPNPSVTLHWAIIQVEAEWLQVYSRLKEYLERGAEGKINLETLHTFNLARQDSLYAALESLHQAASHWHHAQIHNLSRQREWAIGLCLLAGMLLAGWVWFFAIRPAQLMNRWLHPSESLFGREERDEDVLRQLRGTRWEPLAHTLRQQRQR